MVQMQAQIDIEQFVDAAKQGIMAYASAIPQMALQGQDPNEALARIAKLINLREKGTPVQDALVEIFKPVERPQAAPGGPLEQMMGPGASTPTGGAQSAPGGAPGGMQPQGMDLMSMLSGLTGKGEATMSTRTQRQSPI